MTTKGRKYFSGNTLDNAILEAARHHGLRPDEVAYRQLEKRHGFLKARKAVLIEVDPDSPRREAEAPETTTPQPEAMEPETTVAPEVERVSEEESVEEESVEEEGRDEAPEPAGEPLSAEPGQPDQDEPDQDEQEERHAGPEQEIEGVDELIEAAERGLREILAFAKLDLQYEVTEGEDQLEVELHGPDRSRLLEDRGNLILSIQHLLPRLVRGYTGRSIPCHVDSENYHETRRAELKELAEEVAEEVKNRQRPRTLPPMNPAERRIIHVTLADEDDVTTESQGRGFFKRVTISPAMRRPRGFDRYNR